MKYRCGCGNISKISFYTFKKGSRCFNCRSEKISKKQRLPFVEIKKFFSEYDCTLLSNESDYKNVESKLSYVCECGNIWSTSFTNFKKGNRCHDCGLNKRKRFGTDHPNWNKDRDNDLRERDSVHYKKWRKEVFERDEYTCRRCSTNSNNLNAHHIINFSVNKEKRLCVTNGITLCLGCHKKFHSKYGNKNNDENQLNIFLKYNRSY